MRFIKRVLSALRRHGFFGMLKHAFRRIRYPLMSKRKKAKNLSCAVDFSKISRALVFENNFGWTKIMKQRPQHIAENLPPDVTVFYHTDHDADFDEKTRIRRLKDSLFLIDLGIYRGVLTEALKDCPAKFLMIYSTDQIHSDRIMGYVEKGYRVIYEYVDDINRDLMGEDAYQLLSRRHEELMKLDGVTVVCTATELQKKAGRDSTLITNGVKYDDFKAAPYPVPVDLSPAREKYKTLICYYGALANWFDYGLVKALAKNREYGIVLIGVDYDGSLGESGILEEENVFYLGRKPYESLPSYGCNCDVLTIPFLINDITKATSPVKIFEYMAMEKPIVTTDLPECRKYKSVLISKNREEFIENVKQAGKLAHDPGYLETERREAEENDWSVKAAALAELMK